MPDQHPTAEAVAVLQRHGPYDILATPHRIDWRDGSSAPLYPVLAHGHADVWLRGVRVDELHWVVVDLRDLAPSNFAADVQALPRHDAAGVVYYTLRHAFTGADAFKSRALLQRRAAWFADERRAA